MRLLMLGTGPFAVPTFASLLDSNHEIVALVARPVPPPKGRVKSPPAPMRDLAARRGVPILEPQDINAAATRETLAALDFELLVTCDYGQILSAETLASSPRGGINLHASLLPKYRGAAPINWALYHGEVETGVTVLHMTASLDSGPCLVQRRTTIGADEDAVQLESRLAELGVEAVHAALAMLAAWDGRSPLGAIQDPQQATKAPRLKKTDGQVAWTRSALQIANQVRAFKPWPGTFTTCQPAHGQPLRLILDRVSPAAETLDGAPGQIVRVDKSRLLVATGNGLLSLERVQPAGKRSMAIGEFLRGHPLDVGDRLNAEP
jgi:methionyl-tRNA formyltransferase